MILSFYLATPYLQPFYFEEKLSELFPTTSNDFKKSERFSLFNLLRQMNKHDIFYGKILHQIPVLGN